LKSYVGEAATVAYFQQHHRNESFISAIFSSEKKKENQRGPNQARKEVGTTATFLVAKNCCADKAV